MRAIEKHLVAWRALPPATRGDVMTERRQTLPMAIGVRGVLAGAYLVHHIATGGATLTHAVALDAEGWEIGDKTLCGRIKTDRLCDEVERGAPTCHVCASRAEKAVGDAHAQAEGRRADVLSGVRRGRAFGGAMTARQLRAKWRAVPAEDRGEVYGAIDLWLEVAPKAMRIAKALLREAGKPARKRTGGK